MRSSFLWRVRSRDSRAGESHGLLQFKCTMIDLRIRTCAVVGHVQGLKLGYCIVLDPVEFQVYEFNCFGQILRTILKLPLHLAATRKVVADDCLVVRIEAVLVLGLHHDFISLE
jgi:hypothetical protein